jgi:hypothetical protein
MFKRMYSNGNLDLTIDQAVDNMDPDKIDHAITQAERTIQKLGVAEPLDEATYWKNRCLAAELVISETPCDPDITSDQIAAVSAWMEYQK